MTSQNTVQQFHAYNRLHGPTHLVELIGKGVFVPFRCDTENLVAECFERHGGALIYTYGISIRLLAAAARATKLADATKNYLLLKLARGKRRTFLFTIHSVVVFTSLK